MACRRAEEINLEVLLREPESPECRAFVSHADSCADCGAALERRHDPPTETTEKAPSVAVAGAAVVIIAVIALLALSDRSDVTPEPASVEVVQPVTATDSQPARATAQRISEHGRLSVSLQDIPEGEALALNLEMPDEARGEGPRKVRVVDAERQRLLETVGTAASADETGLRIEIAPDWLQPGLYMIEVDTAEKRPLAIRRYVLELR